MLWAKLSTGHDDWLGVRRNGKYVLGRPRLSAVIPDAIRELVTKHSPDSTLT